MTSFDTWWKSHKWPINETTTSRDIAEASWQAAMSVKCNFPSEDEITNKFQQILNDNNGQLFCREAFSLACYWLKSRMAEREK